MGAAASGVEIVDRDENSYKNVPFATRFKFHASSTPPVRHPLIEDFSHSGEGTELEDAFSGRLVDEFKWRIEKGSNPDANAFNLTGAFTIRVGSDPDRSLQKNGAQLTNGLHWSPERKSLFVRGQVKVNSTNVQSFFGINNTALEFDWPFTVADGIVSSSRSNACGFLCDFDSEGGVIYAVAVKNGVVQSVNTGVYLSPFDYRRYFIMFSETGDAFFYIDRVLVAEIENACSAATIYSPYIIGSSSAVDGKEIYLKNFRIKQAT
ncbi:hypothetical protein [Pseudovibrio axinellae]|uniref:hypothetical protein n=1 Tax=Pseudovibrio axinellae TaxID=989403 RepID=UPI00082EDAC5|nr:hypothetical protein [Pseudovibrio axinellae]